MSDSKEEIAQLLRRMKNGSLSAFDSFYEHFISIVYPIACRMMGDPMEAEDLCHDVFLEVWHKIDQYNAERGSFEAWLAVITKSRCLDRLRQKTRFSGQELQEKSMPGSMEEQNTEELALFNIQRECLRKSIDQLPTQQKQVLTGIYYESRTQRELAQKLGKPLGTIKSLVRYGISNLRKQFRQTGWVKLSEGVKEHEWK